jgi:uncharacterized protein (TIGR02231 family)
MKAILTLFFIGFIPASVTLAQQPIVITPAIQEITVYLSGAEIRFKEIISLRRGNNTILFKGLSPSLVLNSVQIAVGANTNILSVSTQNEQLLPEEINGGIKIKRDSIAVLEDKLVLLTNQIDAYDMEKKTLLQNQHIGGGQTGVSLIELTKAADFFRERTLKINNALSLLNKNVKSLNEQLSQKKAILDREVKKMNLTRYNITVTVNSKAEQSVEFAVRHLVSDASWEASYDIVATEINRPVTLKYKSLVYNNTGIDWNDVKLSMSTGDISLNATRPYLTAWILNYASSANEGFLNMTVQNNFYNQSDSVSVNLQEDKAVSELNTSFEVEQRHSILADGNPYSIDLREEALQATFEYLAVPKLELSAFLLAKVIGWEKLNLIDGTANVYYGNMFVGQSNINTRLIGDTLELSLGRDNQIVVSRAKVEDKGSTASLGAKRSESFVYELQLRNNRKVPVTIKVQDQIPISQEKDIAVDVTELSGAALDVPSGRLQWIKNLAPGEASHDKIAFSVRYPKNRTVNIRKSRMVKTPRYRH